MTITDKCGDKTHNRETSDRMQQAQDRSRGALLGLAIGDAIGTTLEFRPPGSFRPLTDMVGGGHFCLKKGYWTDDTSMALCLGHSLVQCQRFDATDQMRRYCDWLDHGYMSSIGTCFDVGVTVSSALRRFQKTGNPYAGAKSRWSSGNGSIMRLAPIAIACSHHMPVAQQLAIASSRTTHASPLCLDSCGFLATLLVLLIRGGDKSCLLHSDYPASSPEIRHLQEGHWQTKTYSEIKGSGYVIDSLEAALWCFYHTDNYADCVLAAANLGNDADTTAAVAGQLAGACYGYSTIRQSWRDALHQEAEIRQLADALFALDQQRHLSQQTALPELTS
jgi:ADP-ribosyl-[dinitrogen reductase] hydrolase